MAKKRDERLRLAPLGEYYEDALKIEAAIKNRTTAAEAASLLCAKLQERKANRAEMVQYLANKRGISEKEMWVQLLNGEGDISEEESSLYSQGIDQ